MTSQAPSVERPVLVAVDFSSSSNEALRQGATRAKSLGCTLIVFHVVQQPASILPAMPQLPSIYVGDQSELQQTASKRLQEWVAEQQLELAPERLRVEVEVATTPYTAIASKAEQLQAQVVVVGHRGHVGFSRLLLGSVAQRVVRSSPCPVLVARASTSTRRMLVTTDFSEPAQKGVAYAVREARRLGFEILLHHNLELPSPLWSSLAPFGPIPPQLDEQTLRQLRETAEQLLRDELTRLASTGTALVTSGSRTDEAIVRVAEERGVELIVMSSHGRSGVERMAVGSVTESVLLHAHCSVLSVREN